MMIIRTTIDPHKHKLELQPRLKETTTASRDLVVGYIMRKRDEKTDQGLRINIIRVVK